MQPGPRLKFKRAILRELVIFLILTPFFVGAFAFMTMTGESWLMKRGLATHRRITTISPERGRVKYGGDARRASLVTSPAGATGVAWVASVGYMASSKRSTWFEPICTRADVSDVSLGDGLSNLKLTFAHPSDNVALGPSTDLRESPTPQIALGDMLSPAGGTEIPESIRTACADAIAGTSKTLLYREAVVQSGRHLDVLGCTADGVTLVPCNDGLDLVTVSELEQHLSVHEKGVALLVSFGGFWNLFVTGIVAALIAGRRVKAKKSIDEAVRGTS